MLGDLINARRFVLILLAIGFALRLAWVLAWPNEQHIGDFIWMRASAMNIAAGRGYVLDNGQPTAFWPIGYPLMLSMLYQLFGPHDLAGKLANVLFSMGLLAGTYALGRRLFSETTARIGLLLMVISPNQIAYNSLFATETVFTMLFVGCLVVVFNPNQNRSTGLLLGTILGLASNFKPVALGLFPLFFLCLWAVRRDWRQAALHTGIALGVTVLLLLPFVVRNRLAFGRWLLTNEIGIVLLVGANPDANGEYYRAPVIAEILPKMQEGGEAEYEWNKEAQRRALQFMREHPFTFLHLGLKKLYHMYKHDVEGVRHTFMGVEPKVSEMTWNTCTRIGHAYYALILLLLFGYVVVSVREKQVAFLPNLCWLFVAYFSFVCFMFHGLPRYHYPLMPLFCLFAASSATRFLHKSSARGPQL